MASSDVPTLADLPGARCSGWNRGKNVVRPPRHANSYPHVVAARAVTPFVPLTLPVAANSIGASKVWGNAMGEAVVLAGSAGAGVIGADGNGLFATPQIAHERRADGCMILRSARDLGTVPRSIGVLLERWAVAAPDRIFLAEREASGAWRHLTYEAASRAANAIGQALLDRGLGPDRPLMILAENGIDHGLMMLGAMHVGVPVVPVSTAYARLSQDFGKLRYIFDLVEPGLIYVDEADRYAKALEAIGATRIEIVASRGSLGATRVTPFAALTELRPTPAVDAAFARVGPDTVAKILFTSGSTGQPKGVINTQGMMCANQESAAAAWTFLSDHPPVIVDWLPWNHTFGGNHNFNMMLRHGGSLYIDEGKPVPALIGRTVANLREISPDRLFQRAARLCGARRSPGEGRGAAARNSSPASICCSMRRPPCRRACGTGWRRWASQARGRKVPFISSWGLTETAPAVTMVHYAIDRPGNIGVPGPGMAVKLVPVGDKLEIRVKGPNVTPGYFRAPDLTAAAFDEEGWLRTGDAVRLAEPDNPAAGLLFDGRTAENFKLSSGTWVNVGTLRTVADRRRRAGDRGRRHHRPRPRRDRPADLPEPRRPARPVLGLAAPTRGSRRMIAEPAVRRALIDGLARHNARAQGSSMRIARCLLLTEPPSIDANEITDKGYLNQRAVLTRRAALVERLHADAGAARRDRDPLKASEKRMLSNTRIIRVQWGDCDPAGIVYYPRYFEWFDACTILLFEKATGMTKIGCWRSTVAPAWRCWRRARCSRWPRSTATISRSRRASPSSDAPASSCSTP